MSSEIVTNPNDVSWINKQLPSGKSIKTLCYRMSADGTSASAFRSKCANSGPSIVIIKTTRGHIFGAYSGISWSTSSTPLSYQECPTCFLWILKGERHSYIRMPIDQNGDYPEYAIHQSPKYGPCFGYGLEMCISKPTKNMGRANSGYTYKAPTGTHPYYIDDSNTSYANQASSGSNV